MSSGEPRRKRRRVAQEDRQRSTVACSSCRRLKEKCNGQVPCDRCIRHARHCEIASSEPRSRRRSGASPNSDSLAERLQHLEAIAEHFLDHVPSNNEQLRHITCDLKAQEAATNDLGSNAVDSLNMKREDFTVKRLSRNTVHYSGELSHWNFSERLRTQIDRGPVHDIDGGNDLGVKDFWRADDLRSPECLQRFSANSLPPRDVAFFLLQMYFDYAQTNTFFVEQDFATEKLMQLYERVGDLCVDDSAWICSILAILAIGSQFAHMGGELRDTTISVDGASDDAVSVTLYRLAATFLPDVLVLASLEVSLKSLSRVWRAQY